MKTILKGKEEKNRERKTEKDNREGGEEWGK